MFRIALAAGLLCSLFACAPGNSGGSAAPASAGAELRSATAQEVLASIRSSGSHAVLLNVWATWCAPCREEFPDLMRLREDYRDRGLDLVLVSADFDDQRSQAAAFLAANGVDFPTFFKQQNDMEFIDALNPDWTGALPASFVFDERGELHFFREGLATYEMLESQVLEVLDAEGSGEPN